MPFLREARLKHARHYLEILSKINGEYNDGGDLALRALAHFDAE